MSNDNSEYRVVGDTLNKISGKVLTIVAGLLISIGTMAYTDINTRLSSLEEKASFLFQDKISRGEFVEQMNQIRRQNDAMKSDILARQEGMKSDILSRLDLILKMQQKGQFSNVP